MSFFNCEQLRLNVCDDPHGEYSSMPYLEELVIEDMVFDLGLDEDEIMTMGLQERTNAFNNFWNTKLGPLPDEHYDYDRLSELEGSFLAGVW